MELPSDYTIAEGPEGLKAALEKLQEQSLLDPAFSNEPHFLLYQRGQQQSLLKIDMKSTPYQYWYYDLQGRPAPGIVKETISRFAHEKLGETSVQFHDVGRHLLAIEQEEFLLGGEWVQNNHKNHSLEEAYAILNGKMTGKSELVAKGWLSFFPASGKAKTEPTPEMKPETPKKGGHQP